MKTTDELALLWQTEDTGVVVDVIPPFRVDVIVDTARAQHRRRWLPFIASSVVCVVALAHHVTALRNGLLETPSWMIASGHALVVCAALAVVFAAIAQRLQSKLLATSAVADDVVTRAFAPVLTTARRAQWATASTLLIAVNLAFLAAVLSFFDGSIVSVVVAVAVVSVLGVSWWQLEALSTPLSSVVMRRAALPVEAPAPAQLSSSPSRSSALPRTSTPAPVVLRGVPGSSAAMISSRHFNAPSNSMSMLSDRERRAWRVVVALVAVAVVPLLIDALAVLGLQWGPQPTTSDDGLTIDVPLLHRVLPYLPIVVTLLASVITPLSFLVGRDVVDRRFAGRFTWLALLPLLGLPAVLTALGLAMREDLNAHLWGYSLSASAIATIVDGSCTDECAFFFVVTVIASLGRLLRFVAVVVVANGLRRLVGPGRLRAGIGVVLIVQIVGWLATAWLPTPDAWRGLIDVVVAVSLLLISVLSQPAFETDRR